MSELWHRGRRGFVRDFLTACLGPDWPGRPDQAQRLLEDLPEEGALERPRARASEERPRTGVDKSSLAFPPPSTSTQRERKQGRNAGMVGIRIAVQQRARGRCEFRCVPPGEPGDAHHVLGGSERIASESVYTVAWICEDCHGLCNASPARARELGLAWARRLAAEAQARGDAADVAGFTETVERLEGRIALAEAQARPLESGRDHG